MNRNSLLRTCPICGKTFIPENPELYVYRRSYKGKTKFFCGWNCTRAWEKNHPDKKRTQGNDFIPRSVKE